MVAWTNAPRAPELAIVQPDCAGVMPAGPSSCHGVASPCALSGLAGTMMRQFMLVAAEAAVAVAVGVAVVVGQIVGVADAVAAVVAAVVAAAVAVVVAAAVAAVVAAAVAGAVATGAAAVPLGVGATVAAAAAGVAAAAVPAAAVAPAAVLAADGVAQAPTLAALLAPNTLPPFGISNAPPAPPTTAPTVGTSNAPPPPPTTATAPTIARSRVRDRGSNLRSWLKTLLLYDTTPFPFNRVYRSRAITVALPLCRFTQNQDFLIFARTAVIRNSGRSSVSAGQSLVDQGQKATCQDAFSDRNNFVRNGGRGDPSAGCPQITPGSTIADEAMPTRPPPGRSVRRGDRPLHRLG